MGSSFRGPFIVRCDIFECSVVFEFRLIPNGDDSLWNHYNVRPQARAGGPWGQPRIARRTMTGFSENL